MTRSYTLRKRAKQKAETHRRIAEAALELHSSVGPANTTLSMVAERAGVQRHTLYAHFPDERSLFMACSGLAEERDPIPDTAPWLDTDPEKRLETGLRAIYDWYGRNASLMACLARDAEQHELTREVVTLRSGPTEERWMEVLGAGLQTRQRVVLKLALSFFTWRTLTTEGGLDRDAAVSAMSASIAAQA